MLSGCSLFAGRSSCSSEELPPDGPAGPGGPSSSGHHQPRDQLSQKLSQKSSLDSGFSDSSDSHQRRPEEEEEEGGRRSSQQSKPASGGRGRLKSAVVHESHALTGSSSRMHHVSKVYFYSVSDVLRDAAGSDTAEKMTACDTEEPRSLIERQYASPIPSGGGDSGPSTPRISAAAISDIDYLDADATGLLMEFSSSAPLPHSPRGTVRTGTSSLRRKQHQRRAQTTEELMVSSDQRSGSGRSSPLLRSLTPSSSSVSSQFPITNGSLYSDLSLSRRVTESQRARRRVDRENSLRALSAAASCDASGQERRDSFNLTSQEQRGDSFNLTLSSLQSELDSMDNPLDASQHSLSFSSSSSCHTHLSYSAPSPPRLQRSPHPGNNPCKRYTVFGQLYAHGRGS